MAGAVDPLQVEAPVVLPLAEPLKLSYPCLPVEEWGSSLEQLTAFSLSPGTLAVLGSSPPSVPENFRAY